MLEKSQDHEKLAINSQCLSCLRNMAQYKPSEAFISHQKGQGLQIFWVIFTQSSWQEIRQLSPPNLISKPSSIQMHSFLSLIHQLHWLEVTVGKQSICWITKLLAAAKTGKPVLVFMVT